jgi:hypothetical protein
MLAWVLTHSQQDYVERARAILQCEIDQRLIVEFLKTYDFNCCSVYLQLASALLRNELQSIDKQLVRNIETKTRTTIHPNMRGSSETILFFTLQMTPIDTTNIDFLKCLASARDSCCSR